MWVRTSVQTTQPTHCTCADALQKRPKFTVENILIRYNEKKIVSIQSLQMAKNVSCNDEPLCCRFKEIADFVVQSMDPPQYVDSSTSPVEEQSKICDYCGTVYSELVFKDHLVAAHAELLFHCEECDTYVDRKDFILHMSLHAVQYASNHEKKTETKCTKKVKKKKDENENTDDLKYTETPQHTDEEVIEKNNTNIVSDNRNEFSDHSDIEYGFGPLPESVFEAIEDSQDSQPAEENDALSQTTPRSEVSNDAKLPQEKTKSHKKSRTCPICSKVFTASSSYFYHIKHFHKKSKEHECDICGKKFATKANLLQHGSIHTGECQFECKECGKRFRSKASQYIHEQTHNGVKRYKCTQCHKSFRWRTHLLRHMNRHAAEKAHVCTTCGRGFSIRCDLLRHLRTHTAGNFACEKCGHKFAQLRYLKVHMDKKHSVVVTDSQSSKV